MNKIKRIIWEVVRTVTRCIPKGKNFLIYSSLAILGNDYDGVIKVKGGVKFYVNKITSIKRGLFFLNQYYEKDEENLIRKIVKPGDCVFDLGANFGWYSVMISKLVGNKGRVYAIEMEPELAGELKRTLDINDCKNVVVENMAVGNEIKDVELFYSKEQGQANFLEYMVTFRAPKGEKTIKKTVPMVILDSYVKQNNVGKINLIKCDIDGSEIFFLRGAKLVLSSNPLMIIEAYEFIQELFGFSMKQLIKEIEQYGYELFVIERDFLRVTSDDMPPKMKVNLFCVPKGRVSEFEFLRQKINFI